jgi:HAD superfamily hydrolase (TIGR01509 family)
MAEPLISLPRPGAVIFDLDGTLVDTVETRTRAWLAVFAEEHIPARRRQVSDLIGLDGRRLAREVATAAGIVLEAGRDEQIDARCGELFAELNHDPRLLPGVGRLVANLDQAGIPWLIATSSRPEQIAASVAALGLARPARVVDGSRVAHAKPAPDLLLVAAGEVGLPPGACWYVGDAKWDVLAAVAAGMIAIGVTTGAVSARTLREAGATWVVATLEDLSL